MSVCGPPAGRVPGVRPSAAAVRGSRGSPHGQQPRGRLIRHLFRPISPAATGTVANVLIVFGVWAFVSGAAQLVVALRRRARLDHQWPLLIAGAGSVVFGVVYLVLATADRLSLRMLAAYALGGGLEFVIQVWLIARRRHRFATMPALS
jgi:uncharacterized membrane protein HdeD (DUF308 family)